MSEPEALSAREAAALLGIKRETLYAYASRGLVRSSPGDGKERRYLRSDLVLLKTRHDARSGHGPVAGAALRWGEPVLDSALTGIDARGPRYRGKVAAELAQAGVSFERVAELLWTGALPGDAGWPSVTNTPGASPMATVLALAERDPDPSPAGRQQELTRARKIVSALAAHGRTPGPGIAATLAGTGSGAAAIDRALVVMADHELNPSSFVARITASTGASLYAVVTAALAALSGPLHGGACERVEALLDEVRSRDRAAGVVTARRRRGEAIPGFGHRLYPAGDPRAAVILADARAVGGPAAEALDAVAEAMAASGELPTVDLALVALTEALGLPRGSAGHVFAVGRSAGWIAHALEQRGDGDLLRPRARYVGE